MRALCAVSSSSHAFAMTQRYGSITIRSFRPCAVLNDAKRMGANPQSNQPDGVSAKARDAEDTPNLDSQSNASQEEHRSGDDHPAKQPDPQPEPSRTTGFGGEKGVKGGKEGLGERTDR